MTRNFTEEDALIIVDAQLDFMPGGKLAAPDGDQIVGPIIQFGQQGFENIAMTGDKHPSDHKKFSDSPDFKDTWPPHCIDGTPGSDVHPGLVEAFPDATFFAKGTGAEKEEYSGFSGHNEDGQSLLDWLDQRSINVLYICGLVTSVCVKATVMEALDLGFSVVVLAEGIRGLDEPSTVLAVQDMVESGASFA